MKKKWLIIVGFISLIIAITFGILAFSKSSYDYNKAKGEVLEYLNTNVDELEKLARNLLQEKSSEIKKYNNVRYYYDILSNNNEYVYFEIKDQSDIIYGLIYSYLDDLLEYNVREINYINNDKGFNITEKLSNKWYFYYNDRFGKTDISGIK